MLSTKSSHAAVWLQEPSLFSVAHTSNSDLIQFPKLNSLPLFKGI